MIVAIDSNIFIYALEGNPDMGALSLSILKTIEKGTFAACGSELVYLEVLSGKHLSSKDKLNAKQYLKLSGTVFMPITMEILEKAAELRTMHNLTSPDAIHLATGLLREADYLITNDDNLRKIDSLAIKVIDVKEAENLMLLD